MVDPFLSSMATNVLRPYGENYLQRGQAFMQSKMSFLSYGSMHYHFNISGEYGALVAARVCEAGARAVAWSHY